MNYYIKTRDQIYGLSYRLSTSVVAQNRGVGGKQKNTIFMTLFISRTRMLIPGCFIIVYYVFLLKREIDV